MADKTNIEWTDATWNIITGCTLVDDGCTNCYAAHLIASWPAIGNHPSRTGLARKNAAGVAKFTGEVRFNEAWLDQPLRWKRPRRIFVCAHGDLFHESVPDEWLDRVFAVMALCPQHTFQVLTKRPDRARAYLTRPDVSVNVGLEAFGITLEQHSRTPGSNVGAGIILKATDINPGALKVWPLPNAWLGTSVSDQASADKRIPDLLATPAAVRFLSMEPLLGPVDLTNIERPMWPGTHIYSALECDVDPEDDDEWRGATIDWVIVGGESGPNARPMDPESARSLRDQCVAAGVPFFFKQWGEWAPLETTAERAGVVTGQTPRAQWHDACGLIIDTPAAEDPLTFFSEGQVFRIGKKRAGRLLDGREWNEMPKVAHG